MLSNTCMLISLSLALHSISSNFLFIFIWRLSRDLKLGIVCSANDVHRAFGHMAVFLFPVLTLCLESQLTRGDDNSHFL